MFLITKSKFKTRYKGIRKIGYTPYVGGSKKKVKQSSNSMNSFLTIVQIFSVIT